MAVWTEYLGIYDAETKTFSALATSPYSPTKSGRIKELVVVIGSAAVTTLVEHVQFKLTCTTFDPNTIYAYASGGGLRTAPAVPIAPVSIPVDQKMTAGVPITIEGRNLTADTPVTVEVYLYMVCEG